MTMPPEPGSDHFRVESAHAIQGPFWPLPGKKRYHVRGQSLAVVMAAKSTTEPAGEEIRVVHVASGTVVFRKQSYLPATVDEV